MQTPTPTTIIIRWTDRSGYRHRLDATNISGAVSLIIDGLKASGMTGVRVEYNYVTWVD